MPWCDDCSRFWSPNSLPSTGACPTCGRVLYGSSVVRSAAGGADASTPQVAPASGPGGDAPDDYKAPWHFKLMVGMAAVYVSWRLVQVATWIL